MGWCPINGFGNHTLSLIFFFFFCLDYSTEDLTCCSFSDVDPHSGQAFNSSLATTGGATAPASPSQHEDALAKSIWEVPPKNSKMPSLKTFRLTKELVEQRVKDNVIIVTFGNYAFMDFILSWVKHLTDLNLSNLLVGK